MDKYSAYISKKLEGRVEENALRTLNSNHNSIDFCSNDYLGFAKEKAIHQFKNTLEYFGSTGSRLISGNHETTEQVEDFLTKFYFSESALLFNSGYNTNVGLFQSLPHRNSIIIYDELIHASVRDGIRMNNAVHHSFKHNNIESLEQKLAQANDYIYVVVESVYSMDGDISPLNEIAVLCEKYGAALLVDEAHAVGIYGKGRGLVHELNLENKVFARIVTFGKAFGCHGAAILGSKLLTDYLINFSRAFIYTTALPLQNIVSIQKAHEFLLQNLNRINSLLQLIEYFKSKVVQFNIPTIPSSSQIQCVLICGNNKVKNIAGIIQSKGFDVRPILSPTVPKNQERIRICIHSFNTKSQIDNLTTILENNL